MIECSHENGWTIVYQPIMRSASSNSSVHTFTLRQNVPVGYGIYISPFMFVAWFKHHAKFPYHVSYLFVPYGSIYEARNIPL